jgi:hypothetical protein
LTFDVAKARFAPIQALSVEYSKWQLIDTGFKILNDRNQGFFPTAFLIANDHFWSEASGLND